MIVAEVEINEMRAKTDARRNGKELIIRDIHDAKLGEKADALGQLSEFVGRKQKLFKIRETIKKKFLIDDIDVILTGPKNSQLTLCVGLFEAPFVPKVGRCCDAKEDRMELSKTILGEIKLFE